MNVQILAPLESIAPNPFQPRRYEDAGHIRRLALSIGKDGLLQIPLGRLIDPTGQPVAEPPGDDWPQVFARGYRIQLAFGHSRLAAYRFLTDTGNPGFERLPVSLRPIDDEDLFRYAIRENLDRKNLSMLEEARAMRRYGDEFGKSSAEVGALFGVSDSTVRGKVRLLDLPPDVQEQLGPQVSEAAARALLTLFDLPEELRQRAEGYWNQEYRPGSILNDALSGAGSGENIARRVNHLIETFGEDISAGTLWKHDDDTLAGAEILGACKHCPHLLRAGGKIFCLAPKCFQAKRLAYIRRYLAEASQASGITLAGADRLVDSYSNGYTCFSQHNEADQAALAHAKQGRCPNLVLVWIDRSSERDTDTLRDEGYEHARIMCRRHYVCTCQQAARAGMALTERATQPAPAAETAAEMPAQIDEAYLKEQNRRLREARRQERAEIQAMAETTTNRLAKALRELHPLVWWRLARRMSYHAGEIRPPQRWQELDKTQLVDGLWRWMAQMTVAGVCDPDADLTGSPETARRMYNALLAEVELEPLPTLAEETPAPVPEAAGVSAETPQPPGAPLIEVLAGSCCPVCAAELDGAQDYCPHCGWLREAPDVESLVGQVAPQECWPARMEQFEAL